MIMHNEVGGCGCGQAQFTVHGEPLTRYHCHCVTCQQAFGAPFSDVTVLMALDVALLSEGAVRFESDGKEPAQNRGVCKACTEPVLGIIRGLPFVEFAVVPTGSLPADVTRIPAQARILYGQRVADVDDDLPVFEDPHASEAALLQLVTDALGPRMGIDPS